jgi:hypothetical protein
METSPHSGVTGMDEDISFGYDYAVMQVVRVAEGNDLHRFQISLVKVLQNNNRVEVVGSVESLPAQLMDLMAWVGYRIQA